MKAEAGYTSYYGNTKTAFYNDTDFDIVDAYIVPADYRVCAILHSHGTAHLEYYDGAAWADLEDAGGIPIGSGAGLWRSVEGTPISYNAVETMGALRVAGSAADNSTLRLIFIRTVKTAG